MFLVVALPVHGTSIYTMFLPDHKEASVPACLVYMCCPLFRMVELTSFSSSLESGPQCCMLTTQPQRPKKIYYQQRHR